MFRRLPLVVVACLPVLVHAACAASNGDPIGTEPLDASPLDPGENVLEPAGEDASTDAAVPDAAPDAGQADADAGPSAAVVRVQEIFVDNDALGDGAEYVELVAPPGTPMDDLLLRLIGAQGQVRYEVAVGMPGDVVGASGTWVVGGNQTFKLNVTDRVDRVVSLNAWGLDNSGGAVQLARGPQRTLLDVVGYTTDPDGGAPPPAAMPPTQSVEGKAVRVPAAGKAFGRKAGAADTGDNAVDFCTMAPSPGYPQKPCE